jgi:hypothetical protein
MNPTTRVILAKHGGNHTAAQEYCLRIIQEYQEIFRQIRRMETDAVLARIERAMSANA